MSKHRTGKGSLPRHAQDGNPRTGNGDTESEARPSRPIFRNDDGTRTEKYGRQSALRIRKGM